MWLPSLWISPHPLVCPLHPPPWNLRFSLHLFSWTLICPCPYVNSSFPQSPVSSPSFADPSLQKSLEIFTIKTPLSPSVLPLDSIRFENVTIIKKRKKAPTESLVPISTPYIPLSTRLKNAARHQSTSPHRVLRAMTPPQSGS